MLQAAREILLAENFNTVLVTQEIEMGSMLSHESNPWSFLKVKYVIVFL
jgi:hypothetical protein